MESMVWGSSLAGLVPGLVTLDTENLGNTAQFMFQWVFGPERRGRKGPPKAGGARMGTSIYVLLVTGRGSAHL